MTQFLTIHVTIGLVLLAVVGSSIAVELPCQSTSPTASQVQVPWKNQHHPGADSIWFGSKSLAVLLPSDGIWRGMGPDQNFGNKLWFWSEDWNAHEELRPELKVYARELNDETLKSEATSATHGYGHDWKAMLTGLGFPAPGCWEVTAFYRHAKVTFTTLVQDNGEPWTGSELEERKAYVAAKEEKNARLLRAASEAKRASEKAYRSYPIGLPLELPPTMQRKVDGTRRPPSQKE